MLKQVRSTTEKLNFVTLPFIERSKKKYSGSIIKWGPCCVLIDNRILPDHHEI